MPDSTKLANEAKTFAVNAFRTPETTALLVRALTEYRRQLREWLEHNATIATLDRTRLPEWAAQYDELRAVHMTLRALGKE
jgi:hypothetical protein